MRLDLAALVLASSAASAPSSTSLGAAPAELCLSTVQAALFVGLLLLGFVIAVASACCAGALGAWGCALCWRWRCPSPPPPGSLPQDLRDLERIARYLENGGPEAIRVAAEQLQRPPAAVSRWYAHWQAARLGPAC